MRSQTVCLVLYFWINVVTAHENTIYPLLKNAQVGGNQKLEYSIVIDADLNQTKFKFFLNCQEKNARACHYENLTISAKASMNGENVFEGKAQYNNIESSSSKKIFDLTLPLPKAGKWLVDFTVLEGDKIIDQRQMPAEIVPEGPNKIEAITYTLPFILMAIIGFRIILFKKRRIQA